MTADPRTMDTSSDPVALALADPVVNGRLLSAAMAFLGRRAPEMTRIQRSKEAEEIVSAAIHEVLKKKREYDPARDIVSWMVGFVANVTRDYLRRHARIPTGPPPRGPELEDLAIDLDRPVADAIADKDYLERLMMRLNPEERRLLEMTYTEDLTFAEIAARLGQKENAVRVRHHRLLGRLRQQCGEDAGEGQP